MFSTDDTIVAIATPPGAAASASFASADRDATAHRARALTGRDGARAAARDARRVASARDGAVDQAIVTVLPRARTPTPAKTSSRSARTAARCCCDAIVDAAMRRGRAARRAGRVHAARVPPRADRSRAGRSGAGSRRRRHAAAGARGVRSARRHADRTRSARSTRRCSICRRGSRRRSIFPTRAITSSSPDGRRRRSTA